MTSSLSSSGSVISTKAPCASVVSKTASVHTQESCDGTVLCIQSINVVIVFIQWICTHSNVMCPIELNPHRIQIELFIRFRTIISRRATSLFINRIERWNSNLYYFNFAFLSEFSGYFCAFDRGFFQNFEFNKCKCEKFLETDFLWEFGRIFRSVLIGRHFFVIKFLAISEALSFFGSFFSSLP